MVLERLLRSNVNHNPKYYLQEETLREAFESKQQGIHTVVVAVGGWTDMEELVGMATYPYQKNVFNVDNADALEAIKNDLRDVICNSKLCICFVR